jgi:hypothetical protein
VAVVLLAACGPKEVDLAVNVVSTACDTNLDPFAGVNAIEVRITGPGIETPLLTRVQRTEGRIQIPQIPAGKDRFIEVRGLAEMSSARPISIGRSVPIEIPDVLTDATRRVDINIFMRKIDTWSPPVSAAAPRDCSTMRSQRSAHSATLLKDGRVFIAGGFRIEGPNRIALIDTEFYDPGKGTFEQGPVLTLSGGTQLPRAFHTATLLRNGQVLLYGGERYAANSATPTPQTSVLIFDVEQGAFGAVPSRVMPVPSIARTRHLALPEASGRVMIVGGQKQQTGTMGLLAAVNEVEFFDPNTNRVEVVTGETLPRVDAAGASVQDGGIVVVAGGVDGNGALTDTVNFFRFDGSTFVRAGQTQQLRTARRGAAAMTLADDKTVLVMGGYTSPTLVMPEASSEAIKTGNNTIEQANATIGERGDACAAVLQQGNVLAVGGRKAGGMSDGSATLVRYDVDKATLTAAAAAPLPVSRYLHTCTTLADGSVLVTGGISDSTGTMPTVLRDAWIYTPIPGE